MERESEGGTEGGEIRGERQRVTESDPIRERRSERQAEKQRQVVTRREAGREADRGIKGEQKETKGRKRDREPATDESDWGKGRRRKDREAGAVRRREDSKSQRRIGRETERQRE